MLHKSLSYSRGDPSRRRRLVDWHQNLQQLEPRHCNYRHICQEALQSSDNNINARIFLCVYFENLEVRIYLTNVFVTAISLSILTAAISYIFRINNCYALLGICNRLLSASLSLHAGTFPTSIASRMRISKTCISALSHCIKTFSVYEERN